MKTCKKCNLDKPSTEFQRGARYKDGLLPDCKPCHNRQVAERRANPETRERTRKWAREWSKRNIDRLRPKRQERYRQNPEKYRAIAKQYRERNPTAKYASELKLKYGLSLDGYNQMLTAQGGLCKLCKMPPQGNGKTAKILHVDHNHETGKVRALLCMQCNRALGMFSDNAEMLISAAMYLVEHDGIALSQAA